MKKHKSRYSIEPSRYFSSDADKRIGTRSLYAAFDILTGTVMGWVTTRHRAKEFLYFLRQVERSTPSHLDLHLILDNSSTHKTAEVKTWLSKHPRIKLHFTPTSASWLNAVESRFSHLERRTLYRGVFSNVKELRAMLSNAIIDWALFAAVERA